MGNKNITYYSFTTEMVLFWRLLLEEYRPTIKYTKLPDNVIEAVLKRLPLINSDVTE